jgi:hypothetical protein
MKLPKRGLQEVQLQRMGYRSSRDLAFSIVEQSRDDFGGYFRFSLKQEMRARNDLDLRVRL